MRAQIRACLEQGDASMPAVAKALATSTRTLQRQLGAEGAGFSELVESARIYVVSALNYLEA